MLFGTGVIVILAFLGWAFVSTWRKKPAVPPTVTKQPARLPSSKPKASSLPPPVRPSEPLDIPSFVDGADNIEITVVTASPAEDGRADDEVPTTAMPQPSKVEVIYEDEAEVEEITSPVARVLVSASGQSDRGKVRRRNEDSLLVFPERSVFAVADGVGGYKGGDVASALAVDTLKSAFERNIFDGTTKSETPVPRRGLEVARAIQMANRAILAYSKTDPELSEMGTTLVAARFSPNKQRVYIGHVGDSRCYRLRGPTLRQLTTDHTMRELGVEGWAAQHLYQAVGVKPTITIDVVVDKPRPDDLYLLCSDGLTKMADDDLILDVLRRETDLEAAVHGLIEVANSRGGRDNVTVILVKVLQRAPLLGSKSARSDPASR